MASRMPPTADTKPKAMLSSGTATGELETRKAAAAAMRVASGPLLVPLLAAVFGFVSAVGGILLAIGGSLPISPYITTISFAIYLVCRIVGSKKSRIAA